MNKHCNIISDCTVKSYWKINDVCNQEKNINNKWVLTY